jgi:hypothetical protein
VDNTSNWTKEKEGKEESTYIESMRSRVFVCWREEDGKEGKINERVKRERE